MQIRIFEKFDPADQRGNIKNCELCKKQFNVFNREHQCKRCLRSVCSECGTAKRDVYKQKMNRRPHRLCHICREQSDFIIEFIDINKLKFGVDSDIALKWHKKIAQKDQQILTSTIKTARNTKKFTVQIFAELWDSYNYSLRQFIGLLTYSSNQNDIFTQIAKVYEQIQLRGVEQKMQNIIYQIIFLLCFSSHNICCDLIVSLHKLKTAIDDGKQLLNLYLKALSINQADIKKISDYSNYKIRQFMGALSINVVTTECSIHVLTRILQKKKIDQAYMFYALILEANKQFLIANRSNKNQCDFEIIRKCKLDKYLDKYRVLVVVKSAPFIKVRKNSIKADKKSVNQNQPNTLEQKSNRGSSNQEMNFLVNFKKKKQSADLSQYNDSEDSWSHKTKSIRDSEIISNDFSISPRKTQKTNIHHTIPNKQKITDNNQIEPQIIPVTKLDKINNVPKYRAQSKIQIDDPDPDQEQFSEFKEIKNIKKNSSNKDNMCMRCQERVRTIQELQEKIQKKDRQISKLQTQLAFKSKQAEQFFNETRRSVAQSQQLSQRNSQLSKLQHELLQKCEQNQSNFKMLTKYQKQNMNLKSQVEQLTTNNKMLKNKLQSASYSTNSYNSSSMSAHLSSQKQGQTMRQNQLLKKTLLDKNKELEELMKKNKLLSFQLDQNQKQSKIKNVNKFTMNKINEEGEQGTDIFDKVRRLSKENQQLMVKIQEISNLMLKEQAQKLKVSQELFIARESWKQSDPKRSASMVVNSSQADNKNGQCVIF